MTQYGVHQLQCGRLRSAESRLRKRSSWHVMLFLHLAFDGAEVRYCTAVGFKNARDNGARILSR
jgi:hypothetical protein